MTANKFPTPNIDEAVKLIQSYDAETAVVEAAQIDIALAVEDARVEVPDDVREAALNAISSEKAHYLNQDESPRVLLELENLERARLWLESLRPAKSREPIQGKTVQIGEGEFVSLTMSTTEGGPVEKRCGTCAHNSFLACGIVNCERENGYPLWKART